MTDQGKGEAPDGTSDRQDLWWARVWAPWKRRLHHVVRGVDPVPVGLGLLFAAGALFVFGARGSDDAYITFWPAHTLVTEGAILNYNGDHVEQSSTLAFTVLLAALSWPWPSWIPFIGRMLSLLSLALIAREAHRLAEPLGLPRTLFVPLATISFGSVLFWATSGMEMTLAAFAGLFMIRYWQRWLTFVDRRRRWPGLVFGTMFFCALRPENLVLAPAMALVAGGCSVIASRWNRAELVAWGHILGVAVASSASLFLFRHLYFDAWLPLPAVAKGGALSRGFDYASAGLKANNPALLVVLPLVLAVCVHDMYKRRNEPTLFLLSAWTWGIVAFVALAGGDWMPAHRFLVVCLPPAALLALMLINRLPILAVARATLALAFIVTSLWKTGLLVNQRLDPLVPLAGGWGTPQDLAKRGESGVPSFGWFEAHGRARDVLTAQALHESIAKLDDVIDRPLWIASGQAGAVNYLVFRDPPHELRYFDQWGLGVDISQCPARARGRKTVIGYRTDLRELIREDGRFRDCGFPRPDILHSSTLRPKGRQLLESHGYMIFYHGRYRLPTTRIFGKDRRMILDGFVAVDAKLAEQAGLEPHTLRAPE